MWFSRTTQQVQPVLHKYRYNVFGGEPLKHMNLVVIDGKEVEIHSLPEEKKKELVNEWNRRAVEQIGYRKIKTA